MTPVQSISRCLIAHTCAKAITYGVYKHLPEINLVTHAMKPTYASAALIAARLLLNRFDTKNEQCADNSLKIWTSTLAVDATLFAAYSAYNAYVKETAIKPWMKVALAVTSTVLLLTARYFSCGVSKPTEKREVILPMLTPAAEKFLQQNLNYSGLTSNLSSSNSQTPSTNLNNLVVDDEHNLNHDDLTSNFSFSSPQTPSTNLNNLVVDDEHNLNHSDSISDLSFSSSQTPSTNLNNKVVDDEDRNVNGNVGHNDLVDESIGEQGGVEEKADHLIQMLEKNPEYLSVIANNLKDEPDFEYFVSLFVKALEISPREDGASICKLQQKLIQFKEQEGPFDWECSVVEKKFYEAAGIFNGTQVTLVLKNEKSSSSADLKPVSSQRSNPSSRNFLGGKFSYTDSSAGLHEFMKLRNNLRSNPNNKQILMSPVRTLSPKKKVEITEQQAKNFIALVLENFGNLQSLANHFLKIKSEYSKRKSDRDFLVESCKKALEISPFVEGKEIRVFQQTMIENALKRKYMFLDEETVCLGCTTAEKEFYDAIGIFANTNVEFVKEEVAKSQRSLGNWKKYLGLEQLPSWTYASVLDLKNAIEEQKKRQSQQGSQVLVDSNSKVE